MNSIRCSCRQVVKIVLPLVTALLLGATSSAAAQTKFFVQGGAPTPALDLLGVYVGQQAGFFKQEGLDVEVRLSANASTAMQLVANNNSDVALSSVEPLLLGHEKGIRAKAFIQTNNRVIYGIAVPQESEVSRVEDLKGLKIGVSNLGSASLILAKAILSNADVPVTPDTFVPVGVGDQALTALRSNNVQALALWDVMYGAMERNGQPFKYFRHPEFEGYGNLAVIASDATIANKRKELCAFGRGFAKATLFMIDNPEAALEMYWKMNPNAKVVSGDSESMKQAIIELRFTTTPLDTGFRPGEKFGVVDQEGLSRYAELIFKDKNMLDKMPPIAEIQTNSLNGCINEFERDAVRKVAREWKQ